jgi:uncharacterized protein
VSGVGFQVSGKFAKYVCYNVAMTSNEKLIPLYIASAHRDLEAGQYNLAGGFAGIAATRAYYACFYAATALLLSMDITRSKHSGVLSSFRQYFVQTNIIEQEHSDFYGRVFEVRHIADYDMTNFIEPDEAREILTKAHAFVARAERYLQEMGYSV